MKRNRAFIILFYTKNGMSAAVIPNQNCLKQVIKLGQVPKCKYSNSLVNMKTEFITPFSKTLNFLWYFLNDWQYKVLKYQYKKIK